MPYEITKNYKRIRLKDPSLFQKSSFRTIPIGTHGKKLIIGKLKGHKKTTAQALLIPLKNPYNTDRIEQIEKYKKLHNEIIDMQEKIYKKHIPVKTLKDTIKFILNNVDMTYEKLFIVYYSGTSIIELDEIEGTNDGTFISPQTIIRKMLNIGSNAILFAHNHPNGNTKPSKEDINTYEKLKYALSLFDLTLLEFIIFGNGLYLHKQNMILPLSHLKI